MNKLIRRALPVLLASFMLVSWSSNPAQAFCFLCSSKYNAIDCASCWFEQKEHMDTRKEINKEKVKPAFESHREDYLLGEFVEDFWVPALQAMTRQLNAGNSDVGTKNTSTTSTVSDAEAADAINAQKAEIAQETAASDALCERVTIARNAASTTGTAIVATDTLNQTTSASLTGSAGTPGAEGPASEQLVNLDAATQLYWNPSDLSGMIGEALGYAPADASRINADIVAPFFEQGTLAVNYQDQTSQPQEEDLDMLRYNLYGGGISRMRTIDQNTDGFDDALNARYQVIAFDSAAQGSFNALVGLHHPGPEGSGQYYRALLNSRGVTDDAMIESMLGPDDAPSLLVQAKILALYQNGTSEVGADTINSSADTRRLAIAQKAANLLIKFELYKSMQRTALQWALLHELKIRPYQRAYEARIGTDPLNEDDAI